MLWYKSWLETRWRFLIGLVILVCSAVGVVLTYPEVVKLMPLAQNAPMEGELGRRIREAVELSRDYRGYVWSAWQRSEMIQMGILFAALLGAGGLLSQRSGTLFTLSMPVSRNRLLAVRAAAGLTQLFILVFASSLMLPLFSPAVGESYRLGDAIVHAACAFAVAAIFYCLSLLLSTVFDDVWRPLLIALGVALVIGIGELILRSSKFGFFRVMSGESWFRGGTVPWWGLLVSAALSAALYYGATLNIARRDF